MSMLETNELDAAKQHIRNLLVEKGRLSGTTSYIQRKMQISYNHAALLFEELERQHFISAADASGLRKLLEK